MNLDDDEYQANVPDLPVEKVDSIIDPRLIERAVKRLKGIVSGNGISPDHVHLEQHDVRILRFDAKTSLKMVTEYGTHPEPGRNTTADPVASEEDFRRKLELLPHQIATNAEQRQPIIDTIFARSDKGFGLKEQRIGFHQFQKTYVRHEKCVTCRGTGKNACARCQGHMTVNCPNCIGKRQIACPQCRGSSHIQTAKGQQRCTYCHGDGKIACPKCAGRGQIKCLACRGAGAMACKICASSGWISHMTVVKIFAQAQFTFTKDGLPPDLVAQIERGPARLLQRHDIEVALKPTAVLAPDYRKVSDQDQPEDSKKALNDTTIVIDYNVTCPIGALAFTVNDEAIAAELFGYQARLRNMPPFLEPFIAPAVSALSYAKDNQKLVHEHIQKALSLKLIKDVFHKLIALRDPKRVLAILQDHYSVGLNPQTLPQLVNHATRVLGHITRRFRYIGMSLGLSIYSGIAAGSLFWLAPQLAPQALWVVVGLLPFIGTILSLACAALGGRWMQQHFFKDLLDETILSKNIPKLGNTLWWSAGMSTLISIMIIGVLVSTGHIANPISAP